MNHPRGATQPLPISVRFHSKVAPSWRQWSPSGTQLTATGDEHDDDGAPPVSQESTGSSASGGAAANAGAGAGAGAGTGSTAQEGSDTATIDAAARSNGSSDDPPCTADTLFDAPGCGPGEFPRPVLFMDVLLPPTTYQALPADLRSRTIPLVPLLFSHVCTCKAPASTLLPADNTMGVPSPRASTSSRP